MSAIQADYRTNKHIPSRKCYQLILEVPEEQFPEVCSILGYPKTGENTYVGIALLDKTIVRENRTVGQTEGEKLRTRAAILSNDIDFQKYAAQSNIMMNIVNPNGIHAAQVIRKACNIESRSELATNKNAQDAFNVLLRNFREWKVSQDYADNLSRL